MNASHIMLHRSCVALLAFVSVVSSHFVPIVGLYGDAAAHTDYTLNLQPPEETAHDIDASLDAILKAEDEKLQLSNSEFEMAKQRMISVEKQRIHDMVRNAFGTVA